MAQLQKVRQPQLHNISTFRNRLNQIGTQIAAHQINKKTKEEQNRVSLALKHLSDLQRRRDRYEVAYLEKQAQLSDYIKDAGNLDDLYQTGKTGGVPEVTADLYDEPFKNTQQQLAATKKQIALLNPGILESVQKLSKLTEAKAFFTEGIGATYKTGTGVLAEKWDPGDISEAAYRERYYPQANIPEYLREYVKKQKPAPGLLEGFQKQLEAQAWEEEKREYEKTRQTELTAEREQRIKDREWMEKSREFQEKSFAMQQETHAVTMGEKERPGDVAKAESFKKAGFYGSQIIRSGPAMMNAVFAAHQVTTGTQDSDWAMRDKGQEMFDAETFRIGLLFTPESMGTFGMSRADVRSFSPEKMIKKYNDLTDKNTPEAMRALEIVRLGQEVFTENSVQMMPPKRVDIKAGTPVPLYNNRDELIAMAYSRYRDLINIDDTLATEYAEDIEYVLGINIQQEHTVKTTLEDFFRKNYIETVVGVEGGYDNFDINDPNYTDRQKRLAGKWVNLVRDKYKYDMTTEEWAE